MGFIIRLHGRTLTFSDLQPYLVHLLLQNLIFIKQVPRMLYESRSLGLQRNWQAQCRVHMTLRRLSSLIGWPLGELHHRLHL